MKVTETELGPITMRTLSRDKKKVIDRMTLAHVKAGWEVGPVYNLEDGKGYATMFKWQGDKKSLSNHLKII